MPEHLTQSSDPINAAIERAFAHALAAPLVPPPPQFKTCPDCTTEKPLGEFGRVNSRPDGRNLYCRECTNKRSARCRRNQREHKAAHAAATRSHEEVQQQALDFCQRQAPKPRPIKLSRELKRERETASAVYNAIRDGAETRSEIRAQTGFTCDRIGDGIAALLTATASPFIRLERDKSDVPRFFVVDSRVEVCT